LPAHDLALLIHAARAAGEIAMRFWRQTPNAWEKPDGTGPVTEADLAVNAMLRDTLRAERPDYGWLSEEDPDTAARQSTTRQFIIDPIDGTRAFMAGEETFAHSLAITDHGTVIAGVVYLPALDRLYTATATGPALKDGEPIQASQKTEIDGATLLTTPPNLAPQHWPGGVPAVKRSFRTSLAYRLCLVAEGRHDGMLTLRDAWEWDIAAGALIAMRAGATVTDRHNQPLIFNTPDAKRPGVLAAAPGLHSALMSQLLP
jgi:myo-inositol-1(or 4)-monophosphatase